MYLIGIDVGGTTIKFGLVKNNEIMKKIILDTRPKEIINQIATGINKLLQLSNLDLDDVKGIGIGFPGIVINNTIKDSPNIGLKNCNIAQILSEEFNGKPIKVINDAEMALLAEHQMGAGKNTDNVVLLTLGTGVGGALFINNQLYLGNGGAGEFGHIVLEINGRKCNCGRSGCAEQYISLTALDRMIRELLIDYPNSSIEIPSASKIKASDLIKAYKNNDELAKKVINKYVYLLKEYLLNICNLLSPNKIIIGGGICYAPDIIEMVAGACELEQFGYVGSPRVEICPAELGNDAGILGVVACFNNL
ncbi:MAG: ROK family protein [Christensenellales bacterium]